MRMRDALNDGEPKSDATKLPTVASPKAFKDKFTVLIANPRSLLEDANGSVRLDNDLHR